MERRPIKKKFGNKVYEKVVTSNGENNTFYPQSPMKVQQPKEKSYINNASWFPNPTETEIKDFIYRKAIKKANFKEKIRKIRESIVDFRLSFEPIMNFLSVLESVQFDNKPTRVKVLENV